jgi:hypothetical protein
MQVRLLSGDELEEGPQTTTGRHRLALGGGLFFCLQNSFALKSQDGIWQVKGDRLAAQKAMHVHVSPG